MLRFSRARRPQAHADTVIISWGAKEDQEASAVHAFPSHRASLPLLLTLLALSGCAGPHLEVAGAPTRPRVSLAEADIQLTILPNAWNGYPSDLTRQYTPVQVQIETIGRTRSGSATATFSPWTMSAISTGPWRPPRWRGPSSAPALRTAIRPLRTADACRPAPRSSPGLDPGGHTATGRIAPGTRTLARSTRSPSIPTPPTGGTGRPVTTS